MPVLIYLYLLIQLIIVAWLDLRTKKILNLWSILNIILFALLLVILPEYYRWSFDSIIYSFAFLAVGFIFFLLKIMGGGDSKYLFSFFLVVPVSMQKQTLECLLISTVLVGLFTLMSNLSKNYEKFMLSVKIQDIEGIKSCFGSKFAFAPVILLAWVWVGWIFYKDIF